MMIGSIANSALGFWVIAFVITLADSSLFLRPGYFAFCTGPRLTTKVRIAEYPFLLLGKEPIITLISYPLSPFFISSLTEPPQDRYELRTKLVDMKRLTSECQSLTVLPMLSLALLCIVGPLISLHFGIAFSILLTMPGLYTLAILSIAVLFWKKPRLNLQNRDIAHIFVELLFCPFLLSNLQKKIMIRQNVSINTKSLIEFSVKDKCETLRKLSENLEVTADEASETTESAP
jgi:hypothetical protein